METKLKAKLSNEMHLAWYEKKQNASRVIFI
jgi:hypothetical protein